MANDLISEILGSVLGGAQGQQGAPGGLGGLPGGLGSILGGMLGGSSEPDERTGASGMGSGQGGALLAMLLPLAMQWVKRNGGVGGLLERFRQQGLSQQAASWVSTGDNEPLSADAVGDVVGMEELSRLSQQLGVSNDEVAGGLAQILPQVVDHLTPSGDVTQDSDDLLSSGLARLSGMLGSR